MSENELKSKNRRMKELIEMYKNLDIEYNKFDGID